MSNDELLKNSLDFLKKQFALRHNRHVWTVCTNVNSTRTKYTLKVCIAVNNPISLGGKTVKARQIVNISRMVSELCGYELADGDNAIVFHGCGLDVGEAVTMKLSSVLFAKKSNAPYELTHHWL